MHCKIILTLCALFLPHLALSHEMTPANPVWKPAFMPGLVSTQMELFNKRSDGVVFYELGVFTKDFKPVPFVSSYRMIKLDYLGHLKFEVFVNERDAQHVEFICTRSKLRSDSSAATLVSSKICSRFK
jgi:hypothetical protein